MIPLRAAAPLAAAALLVPGLFPAGAAEFFVSPDGADTAPGTAARPWRSIRRAVGAGSPVSAGDVITVRGGTYTEPVTPAGDGAAGAPLTLRGQPGETVILSGAGTVTGPGQTGMLLALRGRSHWIIEGLTFTDLSTAAPGATVAGIYIDGAARDITVRNCVITGIRHTGTVEANAHGLVVYGSTATPVTGMVIENNRISHCVLGSSEALVLNGNVSGFTVRANQVHDCNNIGIDLIGYEGVCPDPAQDRARDGVVTGNEVWNIDTSKNPAYGGDPVLGGGDRSAAGIYADGALRVVIGRNHVHHCNYGVELASEAPGGLCSEIMLRNNLLRTNHKAGLIMGGYEASRGATVQCVVRHNTFYRNDTLAGYSGEIALQHQVRDCVFSHNLVAAGPLGQMILNDTAPLGPGNRFDYNRYSAESGTLEFALTGVEGMVHYFSRIPDWGAAVGGETHSSAGSPGWVETPPETDPPSSAFFLSATSAARDAGDPSLTPAEGELDFAGRPRRAGERTDLGAFEFLTPWQAWRGLHFARPDGDGGAAEADADPDADGRSNLLEYAHGTLPLTPDSDPWPAPLLLAAPEPRLRFFHRKGGADLVLTLQSGSSLTGWATVTEAGQTDGAGLHWQDIPLPPEKPGRLWLRMVITLSADP